MLWAWMEVAINIQEEGSPFQCNKERKWLACCRRWKIKGEREIEGQGWGKEWVWDLVKSYYLLNSLLLAESVWLAATESFLFLFTNLSKVCSQMLAAGDSLSENETFKHSKSMCGSITQETKNITLNNSSSRLPTTKRSEELQGVPSI